MWKRYKYLNPNIFGDKSYINDCNKNGGIYISGNFKVSRDKDGDYVLYSWV